MHNLGLWLLRTWRENWLFLTVVGGLLVVFLLLRTPASNVSSLAELDNLVTNGQPTLVELYSNG